MYKQADALQKSFC